MQNMQQTLHKKAFRVKLQSYDLYRLILTLMSGNNKRSYISLKQTWNFKYDFLLTRGIKGLTGLHKCL